MEEWVRILLNRNKNESSTNDYALVSTENFDQVCNFEVAKFDRCLSDGHSLITMTLDTNLNNHIETPNSPPIEFEEQQQPQKRIDFVWDEDKRLNFQRKFDCV